jgi:hypothetical protein
MLAIYHSECNMCLSLLFSSILTPSTTCILPHTITGGNLKMCVRAPGYLNPTLGLIFLVKVLHLLRNYNASWKFIRKSLQLLQTRIHINYKIPLSDHDILSYARFCLLWKGISFLSSASNPFYPFLYPIRPFTPLPSFPRIAFEPLQFIGHIDISLALPSPHTDFDVAINTYRPIYSRMMRISPLSIRLLDSEKNYDLYERKNKSFEVNKHELTFIYYVISVEPVSMLGCICDPRW